MDRSLDMMCVVRCRYCIYAPRNLGEDCAPYAIEWPNALTFDDSDSECCPYSCGDPWFSIMPRPDWFCWKGKQKEQEAQENVQ